MNVRFVVEPEDAVREPVLFRIRVIQQVHETSHIHKSVSSRVNHKSESSPILINEYGHNCFTTKHNLPVRVQGFVLKTALDLRVIVRVHGLLNSGEHGQMTGAVQLGSSQINLPLMVKYRGNHSGI